MNDYVSKQSLSTVARQRCKNLPLCDTVEEVEILLAQTHESLALIENRSMLLSEPVPDILELCTRLAAGAKLTPKELLDIKDVLVITKKVYGSLRLLNEDSFPRMSTFFSQLVTLDGVRHEIEKCIDDKGVIKDDASSDLKKIRSSIRSLHSRINQDLNKLIHSPKISKALQESIITKRNDRYVIAVSANKRSSVNGIVHDTSQSGLTVYVEPISVVEPTNKIRILELDEEREIEHIISILSGLCEQNIEKIKSNFETLIEIDIIQSKAKIAHKYSGIKPDISEGADDTICLVDSKHPLLVLQGGDVVANSVTMGGGDRTLVITGPNTGGKTVLLKQIGLMSLMIKAGLLVPAKPGTSIPVFKSIWADIGDEQSLEQSLSTFSSHLNNVVSIVNGAAKDTLILLDEIGVGTDPKEGAAIAQAVLEHLNESGALTVTTTHYTDLKLLAYSQKGFVNGSLEFNEATFAPTYKLRLGMPGSSKGIVIAERLGLELSVIESAKRIVEKHEDDHNKLMMELEARLDNLAKQESNFQNEKKQFEEKERSLDDAWLKLDKKRYEMESDYAESLKVDFEKTKARIKSLTKELQKKPSLRKVQSAKDRLDEIQKDVKWLQGSNDSKEKEKTEITAENASVGQSVKVKSLGMIGIIEEISGKSKSDSTFTATVKCGQVKVKVGSSDLEAVSQDNKPGVQWKGRKKKSNVRTNQYEISESRNLEAFIRTDINTLDLRGERVEQALVLVDKFIDDCIVSSISPIMIIHGHGTGAIKQAVRQYLKSCKYSKSFRPGEMHEGGDGVTVVDLR